MRAVITQAGPVKDGDKRYSSIKEDKEKQKSVATDVQKTLRDYTRSDDERYKGVEKRVFGRLIYDVYFEEIIADSFVWGAFSFVFVLCFIWYHLESFVMATLCMFLILMSFPFSYLIYTGIF